MPVLITESDFDIAQEYDLTRTRVKSTPGAIVQFVGLVRDFNENTDVQALELQHYPGMTESVIEEICQDAQQRWKIAEPTVIHRVGKLAPKDQIVLVSVASDHRADAFAACEFIMDQLKTKATFWKKEKRTKNSGGSDGKSGDWLKMKETDRQRANRWTTKEY